ncbi:hypothetical protein RND71_021768 [Anisodus tanguticus]|uniref:Uncharacterized protein n=1 Tax=Anisodus tanguticus TaxID=243964 RepID=A0AAE1RYF6_9SOLA|nr:hypothetical protein RND71_021768 [Anisodus tanguticus]
MRLEGRGPRDWECGYTVVNDSFHSWYCGTNVDGGNSRVVSEKKVKASCASKGNIPYFETSAKEGFNIDAAFQCIAKNALKNEPEDEIAPVCL